MTDDQVMKKFDERPFEIRRSISDLTHCTDYKLAELVNMTDEEIEALYFETRMIRES
ncbi:hypothetical protein HCA78_11655 [Listeria booriae]|uniref:Uncharacterized protein n=1 Tax=Listeria booriae TaxID=1552123 RepID=A0A841W8I4_9LIST|nr:hypothetical protein [Listeria booriae]MBC1229789.1 hypothetical protein [Listeria booriae]MBC1233138.1 hypothetical protein [Listeria booriae]MBC2004427.1 hypothetical protein [Listeria booriae]